MKTITFQLIFFVLFSFALANCSAQQAYYGLQQSAKNECAKSVNRAEYAECIERATMSYEEYEQKRKEQNADGK